MDRDRQAWGRLDVPPKFAGAPVFGIDVVRPDMLHAAVRQPPVFGGRVRALRNEAVVRGMAGVVDVAVYGGQAVLVVADGRWRAQAAIDTLGVDFTGGGHGRASSSVIARQLTAALDAAEAHDFHNDGDVAAAFAAAGPVRTVEAVYGVPLVAHACMEPMNATVLVRADGTAEAWASSQAPLTMRWSVQKGAKLAGVDLGVVTNHITMKGGAFGKRGESDFVAQAAFLAARHRGRPVKLICASRTSRTVCTARTRPRASVPLRRRRSAHSLGRAACGAVARLFVRRAQPTVGRRRGPRGRLLGRGRAQGL